MLELILIVALIGCVVWVILQVPMQPVFKNIIVGLAVILVVALLLRAFGLHFPLLETRSVLQ